MQAHNKQFSGIWLLKICGSLRVKQVFPRIRSPTFRRLSRWDKVLLAKRVGKIPLPQLELLIAGINLVLGKLAAGIEFFVFALTNNHAVGLRGCRIKFE